MVLGLFVGLSVFSRDCWGAEQYITRPLDAQTIRLIDQLFRDFLDSLARRDGQRALALVDDDVIQEYDACRSRALSATLAELRAKPIYFCILDDVFFLRLRFTADELRKRTPNELFSDVVAKGLVIAPWVLASLPISAEKVNIGDQGFTSEAVGEVYVGPHQVLGAFSGFQWRRGEWRVSWRTLHSLRVVDREAFMWMTPKDDDEARALRLRRAQHELAAKWYRWPFGTDREGMSLEDEHVREYFEVFLDHPFDPIYLQPMSTWSLQQQPN
jgi:hypothetical protein